MREIPTYQPSQQHREGGALSPEITRKRDSAVKRLLGVADYLAGPPSETPNFYHYVAGQLEIVVTSRGIQLVSEQQKKTLPSPEGTQTLVIAPHPLTPEELAEATTAIWEHDELTPEMRRKSGLPLNEEGLPIAADVEACLEFIDDQDPEVDFALKTQEEATVECTHSCNCYKSGIIKPEHRQAVLTKNGESYDPPGTSPRNKELRDAWRREQSEDRAKLRGYGRTREQAFRGTHYSDSAVPFGTPQQVTWNVNPLYVESERDVVRGEIGLPQVVDPNLRPYLQREYVLDATSRIIEEGYTPPPPQELLGRKKNDRLEKIETRKGWRKLLPGGRSTEADLERLREQARERVAAELEEQGFFNRTTIELNQEETIALPNDELPDQRAIDEWTSAREAVHARKLAEEELIDEPNEFEGMDLTTLLSSEPTFDEPFESSGSTELMRVPSGTTLEERLQMIGEEPQLVGSDQGMTIACFENETDEQIRAPKDKGKRK